MEGRGIDDQSRSATTDGQTCTQGRSPGEGGSIDRQRSGPAVGNLDTGPIKSRVADGEGARSTGGRNERTGTVVEKAIVNNQAAQILLASLLPK